MDASDDVAFAHLGTEIERDFENAGFRCEKVIVSVQGLGDECRRFAEGCASDLAAFEHAGVDENVAQSGSRDAVDACGNALAATEFGGDDGFALVFCFDREESGSGDVRVEKGEIGPPRHHGVEHAPTLVLVGDEVHVCAGDELHAAAA